MIFEVLRLILKEEHDIMICKNTDIPDIRKRKEDMTMAHTKWVCGWATPSTTVAQHICEYFKDRTFRYQIFSTVDASALRIHLSNLHGHEPVTVTAASVAMTVNDAVIDPATVAAVTFGGSASVTIAPGDEVDSDPVAFALKAGQTISVSTYFAELTEYFCGHTNGGHFVKKYMSSGNHINSASFPPETYGELPSYLYFSGVDFLTSEDVSTIVAFGDSITAQPWPDWLARRIYELGIRNRTVVREGIGGNRILRDYTHRIKMHFGVRGIERFAHDIDRTGADRVFVLHGINDLIHPGANNVYCPMSQLPTVDELIDGYKTYIRIAHEQGKKIYLSPILPCPRCMNEDGLREIIRCGVNNWIRSTNLIDGLIDFEAAVWNPDDHKQMLPIYDSGDHLHPSLAGAKQMAYSIPEEYLR